MVIGGMTVKERRIETILEETKGMIHAKAAIVLKIANLTQHTPAATMANVDMDLMAMDATIATKVRTITTITTEAKEAPATEIKTATDTKNTVVTQVAMITNVEITKGIAMKMLTAEIAAMAVNTEMKTI